MLIADPLDPKVVEILSAAGCEIHQLTSEERPRLEELVAGYDALVVRSATKVTAELLRAATSLRVVGRAGIGVDNVDVGAATERGVLVVNAPTANLISATEHTFALLLALVRRVPAADAALKDGRWDRKSFVGTELQKKVLGVIGFGRIGQQVAVRAKAFDMEVVAYDPYLAPAVARRLEVEPVGLEELLERADVVTLHTPMTDETRGMLGTAEIARMKAGALLVNCGRGGLVDEDALLAALDEGRLGGAGLDVFASEPPVDFRLAAHPRVVATPHIGAQTREAQERIAVETARMVLDALAGSLAVSAVNLPFRTTGKRGEPFLSLGEQLGRVASSLVEGGMRRLQVDLWGIEEGLRVPTAVAALKGALTSCLGEGVNYVNAERVAAGRGIEVVRATHQEARDYQHLVRVTVDGLATSASVEGTLFGRSDPRVVGFGRFRLEFRPEGRLLMLRNLDVPGVVGRIGRLLGDAAVNIAEIHLARRDDEELAVAVLRLDDEPPEAVLAALGALPEVREVKLLDLDKD